MWSMLIWYRIYHLLSIRFCDALACIVSKKSFASSYAPKNTAPPELIHRILGPIARSKALAPSCSTILFIIVIGGTF